MSVEGVYSIQTKSAHVVHFRTHRHDLVDQFNIFFMDNEKIGENVKKIVVLVVEDGKKRI